MLIDHFALGMRIPQRSMAAGEMACLEKLLSGLSRESMAGLSLYGGWVDDVYVIVIMGGSFGRMRTVYRRILQNRQFRALLAADMPFIENNRLMRMPELQHFGCANEEGGFEGGNRCFGLKIK